MPANRNIKGLYALVEAFWDITNVITCSIRGAILVALCFLAGGILVIASMFAIGHNHDKKLAEEIRAQNEALAKMARQSSAHEIPIAPLYSGHHALHGVHPHAAAPHAQSVYPVHPATHNPYSVHPKHLSTHPASTHAAVPAHTGYPAHAGYANQASAFPTQPAPAYHPYQPAYQAGAAPNAYPAQAAHPGYTTYPVHSPVTYPQHGYQQPVNPIAVDPIYDSAVTQSQYNQMMQNTPMVASPYGNSINFNHSPAPISQPPVEFGSPRTQSNTAVADANEFAGSDAGRAEAGQSPSVLNTY